MAIDVADVLTHSYLDGPVKVTGPVVLECAAPVSEHSAEASSGASGDGSLGVAGSLAIDLIKLDRTAILKPTADITASDDVTMSVAAAGSSATKARAGNNGTSKFGMGASVSINVMNDTGVAGLSDNSKLGGAKNLTIASAEKNDMTTEAKGGCEGWHGVHASRRDLPVQRRHACGRREG